MVDPGASTVTHGFSDCETSNHQVGALPRGDQNLPMVMVGSDLSVRRFTPQATAMLGLMPGDVGRPIPRLKLKVDVRSLEETMLDVIRKVQPRHDRVQDDAGNWFTLRITPYRTLDNRIDGVVLSVVDPNDVAEEDGAPPEPAQRSGRAVKPGPAASAKRKTAKKSLPATKGKQ